MTALPPGVGTGCLVAKSLNETLGIPVSETYSCLPGYYCPNVTESNPASLPVICPPTDECAIIRLKGGVCKPQGLYEPTICPERYYCPTFDQRIICPADYYCPRGSIKPISCYPFSDCPKGSDKQVFYGGLLLCLILDVILFGSLLCKKVREIKKAKLPLYSTLPWFLHKFFKDREKKSLIPIANTKDEKSSFKNYTSAQNSSMKSLVKFYKKELGGSECQLDFEFYDMGLKLQDGKSILHGVSGKVHSGRLLSVMGPSGAGKTTLMNVLMGKMTRNHGNLLVSGKKLEIHTMKKVIGYVPQEDIMLRDLTVKENILHSARCRLSASSWTASEIEAFVDNLIDVLGLTYVAHSPIGDETTRGISGGQRKRVNIALELASIPLALFLDEPTSGLDSTASLQVANILKSLTDLGITIVSVIHQPRIEIFETFDDVLLLIPGGQTAYIGPVKKMVPYFENLGYVFPAQVNPADFVMDILSGKANNQSIYFTHEQLVEMWESNGKDAFSIRSAPKTVKQITVIHDTLQRLLIKKGAYSSTQFLYNFYRSLIQQTRQMNSFWLEVFVGSAAGALMGVSLIDSQMYSGLWKSPYTALSPTPLDWIAALYGLLIGIACALAAGPAGVKVFGEEKPVFWREAAAGHNRIAYYIAKTFSVFPRFLLAALHFTSVYYLLAQPMVPFHIQFALIALQFYGVYGMSACVSLLVKRENSALLAVIVGLFSAIFCGFGPTLEQAKDWNIAFLWEMMFNKWAAEAQYSESIMVYKDVYMVQESSSFYGYTTNKTTFSICMMALIGTIWRLFGFGLLIGTNRDKQR